VALRNQAWDGQLGVRLLTPLRLAGSEQVILIDRGWVPHEDYQAGTLANYAEPGLVRVEGVVRRSQTRPDIGTRSDPGPEQGRQDSFYLANVERIGQQIPYPLLPVYVQQDPDPAWQGPPHRSSARPQITEGSHLGYAIQWYFFAGLLAVGYPFFVHRELKAGNRKE
jgi:surfeit locus 1 family protein